MIFYFSATGNTLWAARQVAGATGEQLISIPESTELSGSFTLSADERIGFFFPVHGWRPPSLVRDFIKRLHITDARGHYCYALCTAGDDIGETIRLLAKDLSSSGLQLDSAYSLVMPETYVGLPFMDVDTPAREKDKIAKSALRLNQYLPEIIRRERGVFRLDRSRWPRINTRILGHFFLHNLISDKPFRVREDRCVKCGICADTCPVHDIDGGLGKMPAWLHTGRCLTCFACYHHCPQHAIEFGHRTRHKGQYWFGRHQNNGRKHGSTS